MASSRIPVAGSERPPLDDTKRVGDPDPNKRIEVTVTLRRRTGEAPTESAAAFDCFALSTGASAGASLRSSPGHPALASTAGTAGESGCSLSGRLSSPRSKR